MKNKWIMLWVMAVLTVLSAIGGSTGLQLLPLFIFLGMGFVNLQYKKELSIGIVVLALLMTFINLLTDGGISWIDVIVWILVALAWK